MPLKQYKYVKYFVCPKKDNLFFVIYSCPTDLLNHLVVHCDKGKNSDLPVAPAVDGADGQTEPGAAWDVHHVEEHEPLVPARVVGLHFLSDLRLTQSFRSVIDTRFHINLQRRSFLSLLISYKCTTVLMALSQPIPFNDIFLICICEENHSTLPFLLL